MVIWSVVKSIRDDALDDQVGNALISTVGLRLVVGQVGDDPLQHLSEMP